jgi:hypothetical protein
MRTLSWKLSARGGAPWHTSCSWFSGSCVLFVEAGKCAKQCWCNGSLATNIIVSSMLILGGSATVTSLTGMSTVAVSFSSQGRLYQYLIFGALPGLFLHSVGCRHLRRGWWYAFDSLVRLVSAPHSQLDCSPHRHVAARTRLCSSLSS